MYIFYFTNSEHRLHLDHSEIPVGVLQLLLVLLNFPLLAPVEVGCVPMSFLDLFQLLALLLNLCLELLILFSAVHQQPGHSLENKTDLIPSLMTNIKHNLPLQEGLCILI